jgi:hypothetical protein
VDLYIFLLKACAAQAAQAAQLALRKREKDQNNNLNLISKAICLLFININNFSLIIIFNIVNN